VPRRLVITVCFRESGVAVLPIERGERPRRLDARSISSALQALVVREGLEDRVRVREGCAGGCNGPGPNVSVAMYSMPAPGERADHVAVGWKTYVYSLPTLECLAQIIEETLDEPRAWPHRRPAPSAPPRHPPAC
jgi:hypothetical protein